MRSACVGVLTIIKY